MITSLYPCPQCLGKMNHFKIDVCVYLNDDPRYLKCPIIFGENEDIMMLIQFDEERVLGDGNVSDYLENHVENRERRKALLDIREGVLAFERQALCSTFRVRK